MSRIEMEREEEDEEERARGRNMQGRFVGIRLRVLGDVLRKEIEPARHSDHCQCTYGTQQGQSEARRSRWWSVLQEEARQSGPLAIWAGDFNAPVGGGRKINAKELEGVVR